MARGLELFKGEIRPLLVKNCIACHGQNETESGFDITSRQSLLAGGDSGAVLVPGKVDESRLIRLLTHEEEPAMPMEASRLSDAQLDSVRKWIELGAPYDDDLIDRTAQSDAVPWTERTVPQEAKQYWAFQPRKVTTPPTIEGDTWSKTEVDRFILEKLTAAGLQPNEAAERRQLIRRAHFDLTGFPPTAEETEAFVNDPSPDAYEKLIDRLLDSPHYGERWARHWLDVARFAESHGFEQDYNRPYAFYYRDFVIKALNSDLPYAEFVRWQIAGDELRPDEPLAMMATGFLGAGVFPTQITAVEVEPSRYDALDDMASTTTTAFLGMSVGCARCHDHKFDPIPQADYYRMASIFTTTVRSEIDVKVDAETFARTKATYDREHALLVGQLNEYLSQQLPAKLAAWEASDARAASQPPEAIAAILETPAVDRSAEQTETLRTWFATIDEQGKNLKAQVEAHRAQEPRDGMVRVMITGEGHTPIRHHTQGADFFNETYFLKRGDLSQKQGVAAPGFLQVLLPAERTAEAWTVPAPPQARTSFRRAALANWIVDVDQGAGQLAARVIVNRLWQHHFGRGIVATPNDFGVQGTPPSHPELLDWLAAQLIERGWRLKPIHKLLMMSAVYQQSSSSNDAKKLVDPDNTLFWRWQPRRLEAEIVRDAMLKVSEQLDPQMYGPGTLDPAHRRRSIYFMVKRSELVPAMTLFDAPEPLVSIGQRPSTTIAPQALLFLNNDQVREYSAAFARRVGSTAAGSKVDFPRHAYRMALGREPQPAEASDAIAFLQLQQASYAAAGHADAEHRALTDFCQAVMALNEFIFVD